MLDAALALNDLHIKPKSKDQNSRDEIETETLEAFEQRVQVFVQLNLLRASGSRDNYKHSLVFQTRKDLIQDILKASLINKCQNPGCGAWVASYPIYYSTKGRAHCRNGYTFRKEVHTKVIEHDLSLKMKKANEALGVRRRDVLISLSRERVAKQDDGDADGSDSNSGGPESEGGDPTFSDEESHSQPEQENLDGATNGRIKKSRARSERVMVPEECRAHLRLL